MVYGHISAPECCPGIAIWAPEWCLGTFGHRNGVRAHIGTGMAVGQIWAPEWCPGTFGNQNGIHPGAHMSPSSLSVPICHLVPFTVSVLALAFFPVSTCARAPFQCPYVPGHYSSGHMCPGTLPVRKSARATFRCSYVTGNYSGANICPGSLPAPICAWTPFRCLCFPVLHFGAHMFPGTHPVSICARALLRCP